MIRCFIICTLHLYYYGDQIKDNELIVNAERMEEIINVYRISV
jgi:hypothetical protein